MDRIYSICNGCKHYSFNNDNDLFGGCQAFPNGINNDVIGDLHSHDKPLEWQKNDFVYMPATRKIDRLGDEITIHQYSNPYADENGRYKPN